MPEPDAQLQGSIAEAITEGELNPAEVADAVRRLPEPTLRQLLTPEVGSAAIDEIVRRFPEYCDPARTRGVHEAVGWSIANGPGRETFTVLFDDGEVSAARELDLEPRVTLELDAVDFLRLATGNADPATLFLGGRLGLVGDELFAIEMASFLRIPGADGETSGEDALDPSRVDATRIAAVVASAPDEALRSGMRGALRGLILDEIFRRFPDYAQRSRTADLEAAIGFEITGRADGGADRYVVRISGGEITTGRDLQVDPRVTIVSDGAGFLKLVTGNSNPVMAFITGRLKIRGDLGFAAQIPGLFRIPSAA
jgi:putative sterol carrier protein